MSLVYGLVGYVKIEVDEKYKNDVLNICMEYRIPYSKLSQDEFGNISFELKYFDYKKVTQIAEKNKIEFTVLKMGGLPSVALKYKYRFGLIIGVILSFALVIFASNIIWDVRVVGNSSITTGEITQMLEEYGVSVGKRISGIDVDKIQNQILIDSNDISFIAINLSGNIASVEIRENRKPQEHQSSMGFANVVAKKSGIIQDVRAYVGNVVVKSGQLVKEGEVLISGLYDSNVVGIRYTRAAGEVMAKTVEEYYIEIPLKYVKKHYTGVVNYEKSLNFFGKTFNISKKGGKDVSLYDTIYNVGNYSYSGSAGMPISVTTISYHEYEIITAERTVEEAEALAYYELDKKISSSGAEFLLKKTVVPSVNEDFFSLKCIVVYIENIARTNEFFVDTEN